jgi:hypothetical protein
LNNQLTSGPGSLIETGPTSKSRSLQQHGTFAWAETVGWEVHRYLLLCPRRLTRTGSVVGLQSVQRNRVKRVIAPPAEAVNFCKFGRAG